MNKDLTWDFENGRGEGEVASVASNIVVAQIEVCTYGAEDGSE